MKLAFNIFEVVSDPIQNVIKFNDQEIQIKQYLPVQDKMSIIEYVVAGSFSENDKKIRFYNTANRAVIFDYFIAKFYTDINIPDIEDADIYTIYNILVENKIIDLIKDTIPKTELGFLNYHINKRISEEFRCIGEENKVVNMINKFITDLNDSIPKFIDTVNNLDADKIENLKNIVQMNNVFKN